MSQERAVPPDSITDLPTEQTQQKWKTLPEVQQCRQGSECSTGMPGLFALFPQRSPTQWLLLVPQGKKAQLQINHYRSPLLLCGFSVEF